ncbi:glycosyltransferase [Candidatus Halocynthiibacter alkanivorans]|uniref:glycosyltransferase n=1 Tax=Candidatus Halocynthiibacter alkanivorans TaxID=2267619 RepID=UPI000DF43617|nr:glycosyltransferase [Candidatus Halocynthiibacter alkanivorans]
MVSEQVSNFVFDPGALAQSRRKRGISAFIRIRNGADFLESTIRSHIGHFDEIVAVYNQCTDNTADILGRLVQEFGPRLRVFHYIDRVHPPGSEAHAKTPSHSPGSMVNYSNFALAQTRHQIVTKLDDDHLAMPAPLSTLCKELRAGRASSDYLHCISGLNLMRKPDGGLALPEFDLVSGGGDIGFFRVSEETRFIHDRRFERFQRGNLKRRFAGYLYWHLKYLKRENGFGNYELSSNPDSRFARKKHRFTRSAALTMPQAKAALTPGTGARLQALINPKAVLKLARNSAVETCFPQQDLETAMDDSSPGWRDIAGLECMADGKQARRNVGGSL